MSDLSPDIIRRFVDGDLEADEARRVEAAVAANAQVAAQVRFERTLRNRVAEVMTAHAPPVPADLEACIRRGLRGAGATAARDERAWGSWLDGPKRANVFAVAASLALVAGAVLFGIFGPQVNSFQRSTGASTGVVQIAQFASQEHRRCAGEAASRDAKAHWGNGLEARASVGSAVGGPLVALDLGDLGYRFVGAGPGGVPGAASTVHLIYASAHRGEDGCPEAMLSLFVVPDEGQFGDDPTLPRQPWEWTKVGDRPECTKRVGCATDGERYYFLVCCDERDLSQLARQISDRGRTWTGGP